MLDEEMARGVLAARSGAVTAPQGRSYATYPVLRQMHELVDSLGALWPNLQGGAAKAARRINRRPATQGRWPK